VDRIGRYAIGLVAVALASGVPRAGAEGPAAVTLRESARPGSTTRASVGLKAEGLYLPGVAPGTPRSETPKPLALRVELRLDYLERVLEVGAAGAAAKTARRVTRAASALNGEIRPSSSVIRPAVALLAAAVGPDGVTVWSPLGPLTRQELELVQGPGDPLAFAALLPERPVKPGDRWPVGEAAARSLSGYDVLSARTLGATLESADAATAEVALRGEVRGATLGGEGSMACDGSYSFDRKAGLITRLTLKRAEARRPGVVEEGLDLKSTLTVTRAPAETPAELADAALAAVPTGDDPSRRRLLLNPPGGKYSLTHDRDWHIYWEDARVTVLKRVRGGRLVAQCNLAAGPDAGRGKHQDPGQFRDDVRKGLGERFGRFLGEGELAGDPAGGYRYKVGVLGRQGELGVVWDYYLIAAPGGDQLLATFTLADTEAQAFGDEDETLIGSLRWADGVRAGAGPR